MQHFGFCCMFWRNSDLIYIFWTNQDDRQQVIGCCNGGLPQDKFKKFVLSFRPFYKKIMAECLLCTDSSQWVQIQTLQHQIIKCFKFLVPRAGIRLWCSIITTVRCWFQRSSSASWVQPPSFAWAGMRFLISAFRPILVLGTRLSPGTGIKFLCLFTWCSGNGRAKIRTQFFEIRRLHHWITYQVLLYSVERER